MVSDPDLPSNEKLASGPELVLTSDTTSANGGTFVSAHPDPHFAAYSFVDRIVGFDPSRHARGTFAIPSTIATFPLALVKNEGSGVWVMTLTSAVDPAPDDGV